MFVLFISMAFLLPFLVLAAEEIISPIQGGFADLLRNVIYYLKFILVPIGTIMILYASFLYLTSGGSPEKVKTAHKVLTFSLLGMAVVLIGENWVNIINSMFGGGGFRSACDVANLINGVKNVFAYIVYVFSSLSIMYAAFLFLTSGGSPERVNKAKSAFLWGIVGVAVALFSSYAATFLQNSVVGGSYSTTCPF